jgi:hypothetical protein
MAFDQSVSGFALLFAKGELAKALEFGASMESWLSKMTLKKRETARALLKTMLLLLSIKEVGHYCGGSAGR